MAIDGVCLDKGMIVPTRRHSSTFYVRNLLIEETHTDLLKCVFFEIKVSNSVLLKVISGIGIEGRHRGCHFSAQLNDGLGFLRRLSRPYVSQEEQFCAAKLHKELPESLRGCYPRPHLLTESNWNLYGIPGLSFSVG